MSGNNNTSIPFSARVPTPPPSLVPPQPTYPAITFHKTQRRYAQRPINQFPWKDFHVQLSGHGYVVGPELAMTTFDDRTDDRASDSKRLQTIDEGTEIRYIFPYDSLNYGIGPQELNVVEELRCLDLHRKKSLLERMWSGMKGYFARVKQRAGHFCRRLLLCA